MLVIFFDPFEAFLFCNCLRIILMFFASVKSCEVKKCKIDKHMELGLYRQPIINFQGPKSKGTSRGMYVKVLFVVNVGKIQLQRQLLHPCHLFFR